MKSSSKINLLGTIKNTKTNTFKSLFKDTKFNNVSNCFKTANHISKLPKGLFSKHKPTNNNNGMYQKPISLTSVIITSGFLNNANNAKHYARTGRQYNKHLFNSLANFIATKTNKYPPKKTNSMFNSMFGNNKKTKTSNNTKKSNTNQYYTGGNKPISLGKQLGKGGEGTVYVLHNDKSLVAKIYHKITPNLEDKIKFMVKNPPAFKPSPNFTICWPKEILTDSKGKFVGYIMNKGFDNSVEIYELTKPKIKNPKFTKFDSASPKGRSNKLKLILNICAALVNITESKHYVMVDFKPQNILTDNTGRISILDTDSYQISDESGKILFGARVATPEYTPKEYANITPSKVKYNKTTDLFAIAVSFYQILLGIHPYVVKPKNDKLTTIADFIYNDLFPFGKNVNLVADKPKPHLAFQYLPKGVQELFVKAFSTHKRPTVRNWGDTILYAFNGGTTAVYNKDGSIDQTPIVTPSVQPKDSSDALLKNINNKLDKIIATPQVTPVQTVDTSGYDTLITDIHTLMITMRNYLINPNNSAATKAAVVRCAINMTHMFIHMDTKTNEDFLELEKYFNLVSKLISTKGTSFTLDVNIISNVLPKFNIYKIKGHLVVDEIIHTIKNRKQDIAKDSKTYKMDELLADFNNTVTLKEDFDTLGKTIKLYDTEISSIIIYAKMINSLRSFMNISYYHRFKKVYSYENMS